uniref:Uncharacterized protein n=1 Tax=Romanomermis culicivorax TaxID=13658 RepID=A0A915JK08_ROMCU
PEETCQTIFALSNRKDNFRNWIFDQKNDCNFDRMISQDVLSIDDNKLHKKPFIRSKAMKMEEFAACVLKDLSLKCCLPLVIIRIRCWLLLTLQLYK